MLLGGADAALFTTTTTSATGFDLSFLAAPDFEAPGDSGADGTYDVTVTVQDSDGASNGQNLSITVQDVNEAPVATPDAPVGDENTVISGTVTATDDDGDTVVFSKASDPNNGSVVVNADGTYDYTPNADFSGTDSFDVLADDQNGGTDTVTVVVGVTEIFDLTTYEGSLPTPIDRVDPGERVVAAVATSGQQSPSPASTATGSSTRPPRRGVH